MTDGRPLPSPTFALLLALALLVPGAPPPLQAQEETGDELFQAMEWRNVGPFRGGRSVAAAGVAGDPMTYYFGATGGGVWKTTDAGVTWRNVSDGYFGTGSVGAVAVSESDPNVVWVGMGEHAVRGVTTSHGDGVYRSTDGGRTWSHMGLEATRAVSRIRIHPRNPDLVYVAAQGAPYGPTPERGIYRSRDGGESWERVLHVSETAGASDLSMDMTNPRILYAAFWDHLRRPWVVRSGGEGSGIWRSTDGGETWERLREGLPELMGKVGVDVSRADPDRVFAIVEAPDGEGGLYRSDDRGRSWRQLDDSRVLQARAWYYMEVYADPTDRNTVYVLNAPMLRSVDGGREFEEVEVRHGDTHDLWIAPDDGRRMINANDGGAHVSFNGGETWSTLNNQPTVQFYRVITDEQFPYRIYGGQQDNSSVSIASAAPGGIGWKDWHAVSGCESAYLAFDPEDPEHVFGGCYQGQIERWDRDTRESKPVMAEPFLGLGTYPRNQPYRFNWNAPIVASPHDPGVIYHAANVVLKTEDGGLTWTEISPDLTRDEPGKQGAGGEPITNEGAGGENYNTIMYLAPSPHAAGVLWVGSDDGLVHVTRNGGESWDDVTPEGLGEGMINSIEVSPHDPARAYVVFTRYKFDDFTPHIYRTDDWGASWDRVADGIEAGAWVRVVREDPEREGLLYAGTELGMYLSMDGGRSWRPWQLDLPVVPVTDLTIRRGDLVAATQGRGFWVLDDLSPVRRLTPETAAAPVHLYRPRDHVLVEWGGGGGEGEPVGENPPEGVQIFFTLAEVPGEDELVTLEILDEDGRTVRTYASDPGAAGDTAYSELGGLEAGLNRAAWDFRHEAMTRVPGLFTYGSLQGRRVPPGSYTARLGVGDTTVEQPFRVLPRPDRDATPAQYRERDELLASAAATLSELHASVNRMRSVREQVEEFQERTAGHARAGELASAADSLTNGITAWEEELVQPRQKTFQDVINFRNKLNAQILYLIGSVDGSEPPVTEGARERLETLQGRWSERRARLRELLERVEAFNRLVRDAGVEPVVVPEAPVAPRMSLGPGI